MSEGFLGHSHAHLCVPSVAACVLRRQSWIFETEWPAEVTVFALWPLTEQVCQCLNVLPIAWSEAQLDFFVSDFNGRWFQFFLF